MSEGRKSPRLRFKNDNGSEFPNWIQKSFSEIYKFEGTNSFSRDKLNYEDGEVKNIHYGDIHTKFRSRFKVQDELVPFVNPQIDLKKFKTTNFLKSGDLVIADASEDYGDIGKSIEIIDTNSEKIVSGLHTIHARKTSDEIMVGFSSFLMSSQRVRKSIMMIAQGTKVLGISSKRLGETSLLFPSLPEQKKISEFLTSVYRRIELLEKKKSLLETYKKGVMKKIFSQEIRFKDDEGNDFPEWEEKRLGEVGEIITGKTPSTTNPDFWEGKILFITPTDITDGEKYQLDTIRKVKDFKGIRVLPTNSIIFTCIASIGKMSITTKPSISNQQINSIIPFDNNSEYIYYILLFLTEKIKSTQSTTTLPIINKTEFSKISIKYPSFTEQIKISSFLSSIDHQIELIKSQIEKTKTWKKGLLQKMFI
jgi:type I restriction enzyme S subunit